jgi:hypothetical protein
MPSTNEHGPGIKDAEQYEALRDQGASKEKAARIANLDSAEVGHLGGRAPAYEEWTRDDLYERARDLDVGGRSGMDKDELIDALRSH